jgi:two-component system, chemotaxis family, protein-glutamate methylesterase/glutaminase
VSREAPLRVLIIDDSAANRRSIASALEDSAGIEVIHRAADGEAGLRATLTLLPDVITLDLEMPKLDGFSFLRLLQAQRPTPVIVLSSYAHQSDVFKALQLGAFDFVAKGSGATLESVRAELVSKVRAAGLSRKTRALQPLKKAPGVHAEALDRSADAALRHSHFQVVLIGASTGGPPAVQRMLEGLSGLQVCVVIAQHMPPRFTEAFAQRLDQVSSFRVAEATSSVRLEAGRAFVAPGGKQIELTQRREHLGFDIFAASAADAHAPSIDRLFVSAARVLRGAARAIVLTGMGCDGAIGTRALHKAGADVWAEAESSAVVFGMPQAAIATGGVRYVLPLGDLRLHLRNYLAAQK